MFKSLEPLCSRRQSTAYPAEEPPIKKTVKKQTTITDTFKERKRKFNDLDISQSKEKKKRDNAVIEKIRHLKESFRKTSEELRDDQQKSVEISNKLLDEMMSTNKQIRNQENNLRDSNDYDAIVREYEYPDVIAEDLNNENDSIGDEHFDSILNEIENEISKGHHSDGSINNKKLTTPLETTQRINNPNHNRKAKYNPRNIKKPTRCNYNFIELLERNEHLSEEDTTSNEGGFSDTIKNGIEKFLMSANANTTERIDPVMTDLISIPLYAKSQDEHLKTVKSGHVRDVKLQSDKDINKDTTTLTLKPTGDLASVKEKKQYDVLSMEYPEVEFRAIEDTESKNQDYCIQEYTPYNANLVNIVNQGKNYQNVDSIKPGMCIKYVNNVNQPTIIFEDLLKSPSKDHPYELTEKCQHNNLMVRTLEQERYRNFEVRELMLPNFNVMSLNNSQRNDVNTVKKLNQPSIVKSKELEKKSIAYLDEHITEDKHFEETMNAHPLLYKTTKDVNINIIPLCSKRSLQKTNYEDWDNLKSDTNAMSSTTDREPSGNGSPFYSRQERYVNNYSFSTTKVDVQTKKHADLQVQIIRKLKVDLDVTEILTRENNKVNSKKGKPPQTRHCGHNRLPEVPKYSQKCETTDRLEEIWPELVYQFDCNDKTRVHKSAPKNDQQVNQDAIGNEPTTAQGPGRNDPKNTENPEDKLENLLEKYGKKMR